MSLITGQTVVVTGGTGSFGRCFVRRLLTMEGGPKRVCVLSRDEYKQGMMRVEFDHDPRLRFFLGDVRDIRRLAVAFQGAALVVHAAALKQIPACEYNIEECVATNIMGALNVAKAAIECSVPRVIALSTDKAVSPATGYGASKMMLERIIVNENAMASRGKTRLACTRYGNVQDSRLSVLPVWREAKARGEALPVTHPDATRFHMTQEDACDLVFIALAYMEGGEVFVPKLRAYRIGDLAEAVAPGWTRSIIGLRAAEKMHESLIGEDELRYARDYGSHYRIFPAEHPWRDERPAPPGGEPLPEGMRYRSDAVLRMDVEELREAIGAF